MSDVAERVREQRVTARFALAVVLLTFVVTLFTRLRIHFGSVFPSTTPLRWFATGVAEELAISIFLAGLAIVASRGARSGRWSRRFLGAAVAVQTVVQIVRSEVVILFGGVRAAIEFGAGEEQTTVLRSVAGRPLAVLVATIVVTIVFVAWGARRAALTDNTVSEPKRKVGRTERWLAAAAVLAAIAMLPMRTHRTETTQSALRDVPLLFAERNRIGSSPTVTLPRPRLPLVTARLLLPESEPVRFLSDDYPLARVPLVPSTQQQRPNIVIFTIESLRSHEVGVYGNTPPGVTPNLDRLANEGLKVEEVYAGSGYTPAGELAMLFGLLPLPNEIAMKARPAAKMTGLFDILRENGWKSTLWIHNGDSNFYERDKFYLPRGVQIIDGNAFPPDAPRTNWGYSDIALAHRAVEALDRAPGPFSAFILTVTNHHPFQLPSDAKSRYRGPKQGRRKYRIPMSEGTFGFHTDAMVESIHYSDEALGEFMRLASKRPWFSNTIFVIAGDHGLSIPPFGRDITNVHELVNTRVSVPLVFYSPLLGGGRTLAGPASLVDIPATLLAFCGIDSPRAILGRNLLGAAPENDRKAVMWNTHERIVSVALPGYTYHAIYAPGEVVFEGLPQREIVMKTGEGEAVETDDVGPELLKRFRALRDAYIGPYSWLLANDRADVP